jgi:hypothetical protein
VSVAPPTPPSRPPGYQPDPYGPGWSTQLPALNGEFLFFLFVWAVVGIITLAADSVAVSEFVTATIVLGAAYLLSRGIAKAGKVLEGP